MSLIYLISPARLKYVKVEIIRFVKKSIGWTKEIITAIQGMYGSERVWCSWYKVDDELFTICDWSGDICWDVVVVVVVNDDDNDDDGAGGGGVRDSYDGWVGPPII